MGNNKNAALTAFFIINRLKMQMKPEKRFGIMKFRQNLINKNKK